jgi:hypothetical protein
MIKKLPIQVIPFDIEELLKDMDVDKVSYINDASNNLQQTADSYQVYEKLFNEHNTTKYGVAPFSRHIFKEHLPQVIIDFIESIGFTEYGMNLLIQYTGECSPNHYDLFLYQRNEIHKNTTKEDYYRYFIFLNDRTVGQFYHVGPHQLHWKAGDMYYQDCTELHGAGNISSKPRYTLIIDSLKKLSPFQE